MQLQNKYIPQQAQSGLKTMQCLRFISFCVDVHRMTKKSCSLKEDLTSPRMQVVSFLGIKVPVEIYNHIWINKLIQAKNTALCRILDSTNICLRSCQALPAYLHDLVFGNCLNDIIREHIATT